MFNDESYRNVVLGRGERKTMATATTRTCSDCNGTGQSRNGPDLNCEYCDGRGQVETYASRQQTRRDYTHASVTLDEAIEAASERYGFAVITGRYKILDYHKPDGQQIATADNEEAARTIVRALNASQQPTQPAPDGGEWSEPYYVRGQGWLIADKSGCIAQVRNQTIAKQIVADHRAMSKLTDTLRLTHDLLTNQQLCERTLCESCQTVRQTVIEAIDFALTTTTQPDAGEGR
jgi:hypothetical protein